MQPTFFPHFSTETKSCSRLIDQKTKKIRWKSRSYLKLPPGKKKKYKIVGVYKAILMTHGGGKQQFEVIHKTMKSRVSEFCVPEYRFNHVITDFMKTVSQLLSKSDSGFTYCCS